MEAAPEAGRRPAGRGRRAILSGAAVLVLVLTAVVAYRWGSAGSAAPAPRPHPSPSPSKAPTVADIYSAVAPSVVLIEAAASPKSAVESTGTGVVVNADGSILTALHVVKGAADIKVTFADGTVSAAAVAAADPTMDIAILTPATLPSLVVPAVLGSSGRVAVGDSVVAIGNQLGLADTTTAGVVSGLGRRLDEGPEGASLTGLIQFDAAVNPGSSGGPLVDGRGQTIGIVVALANPTSARTFIGIGFAVPIGAALGAGGGQRQPQQ